MMRVAAVPTIDHSMKVEHALREVQVSRSRLRFLLAWLEQVSPMVTDPAASDAAEDQAREPPSLALSNSVLSILREPLPAHHETPGGRTRSRVSNRKLIRGTKG